MQSYLLEMIECPACHGRLYWCFSERSRHWIETAEARCSMCGASYPIQDGIGLFLTPDLPRNDLWEQVDSGLIQHLRAHPELERQLVETPLDELTPADQFLRALVLEAHGQFEEAQVVEDVATRNLYTAEYKQCWDKQVDMLVERLSTGDGPIVDLASGRGYLVKRLIREFDRPVVVTDFSPGVLRRNREWLRTLGLDENVSLLAFDARRSPFKDRAVKTLTTSLGLPNIEKPGQLLQELRRIVSGVFLSIAHFFAEDDEVNGVVIKQAGLEALLYRRPAWARFESVGWEVKELSICLGEASPTPPSAVLEGVRIDGLPVADTALTWCLWEANNKE